MVGTGTPEVGPPALPERLRDLAAVVVAAGRAAAALVRLGETPAALRAHVSADVAAAVTELARAAELVRVALGAAPPPGGAAHILLVDGDAGFRARMAEAFGDPSCDLACAASDERAVALAAARRPDAVLLDGSVGAVRLARRLRALPGCATVPIVYLSACADPDQRLVAAEASASLFLRDAPAVAALAKCEDAQIATR